LPADDARRIRAAAGVSVVDDASPSMLLVEGADAAVRTLAASLTGWLVVRRSAWSDPTAAASAPRAEVRRGTPDS